MKLASIVPIKNINRLYDGDYAMLLAHLKDHYPAKEGKQKNCYTIMDNSLIELGGAVSVKEVYEAAVYCDADEFILPDAFLDCYKTLHEVDKALEWLYTHFHIREKKIMAVAQGKNKGDLTHCFHELEEIPEIHCIGIPKVAETLDTYGRPGFEDMWLGSSKAIHLLGCWTSLREFKQYRYPAEIRSTDTCIPALLSMTGDDAWSDRPKQTINLLEDSIDQRNYEVILNTLRGEGLL